MEEKTTLERELNLTFSGTCERCHDEHYIEFVNHHAYCVKCLVELGIASLTPAPAPIPTDESSMIDFVIATMCQRIIADHPTMNGCQRFSLLSQALNRSPFLIHAIDQRYLATGDQIKIRSLYTREELRATEGVAYPAYTE